MTPEVVVDWAIAATLFSAAVAASGHVVLTKSDVRAAIGWIGLIWLVPGFGAVLYWLFGINRIRRRAHGLRRPPAVAPVERSGLPADLAAAAPQLDPICRLAGAVTGAALTTNNAVTVHADAVSAMEAMLAAIAGAQRSVGLASYIIEGHGIGERFAQALGNAHARGVAVRVLVDGVGRRYTPPSIIPLLERRGIAVAEFLPTRFPFHLQYANLRNHRKILVVDGSRGFTGGVNIRNGYALSDTDDDAIRDVHIEVCGPVVEQMFEAFADDWSFCTDEPLHGAPWQAAFPPSEPGSEGGSGAAYARAVASGPDRSAEPIRLLILAALAHARRRVRITTPYFLPDTDLRRSLATAALRGVSVEIMIPDRCNLRLVQWASRARLGELLEAGCRILESSPPFDHRKTMTVDGMWSVIGSANWDERSFRLNFELNVEIYDAATAATLDAIFESRCATARPLTAEAMAARPLPRRFLEGAAWLLSPYL